MSSTNRSESRNSHISDYYITPKDAIRTFLKEWIKDNNIIDLSEFSILDPCAGGDKNNDMSYPSILKEFNANSIKTIDIREDSKADIKADYLNYDLPYKPNLIITNPPFMLLQEITEKALKDVADKGYVIMLMRLNFFGGQKRFNFWKNNMPFQVYVHNKRMCFTNDGKTDSIEYCHTIFTKNIKHKYSLMKII